MTFNRIDFDQDDRYLRRTSGSIRRDSRTCGADHFFNSESGFVVLRVQVRGQRDPVTILGSLPSVSAGEWLTADGWWIPDKEHGLQFKAKILKTIPPTTSADVERYLSDVARQVIRAKRLPPRPTPWCCSAGRCNRPCRHLPCSRGPRTIEAAFTESPGVFDPRRP
jgi:hypothetical protein